MWQPRTFDVGIRSDRVHMLGLVDDRQLEAELQAADIAFVSQRYEGSEFNIPSKLMNFMAYGLPVLAAVNPAGEVARIIRESGAGWVVDSSQPGVLPRAAGAAIQRKRGDRAASPRLPAAMRSSISPLEGFAERFEQVLEQARSSPVGAH